ncbi:P-II family nitrogen regulator [Moorella naiadis]|uniref:P-II family nitrogen regulator n=1 Tax=Moorella naiadis (nom. illeg.) TaxID=3093670 RepID=UPI003D9C819C
MYKIEAIIRPEKFESVKEALGRFGIHGLTVTHVVGCGQQKGKTEVYRGATYNIDLLPKVKVEIVLEDRYIDDVVAIVTSQARTGNIGDGKIFIYRLEDAVRIRTGERGAAAI